MRQNSDCRGFVKKSTTYRHSFFSVLLAPKFDRHLAPSMYLIFDTETTGLPKNYDAPLSDSDNWPRCIQIAWQLHDAQGYLMEAKNLIIKPEGFDIPFNAVQIHGIT